MDDKALRDHLFLMRRNVARGENSIAWQKQVIGELSRSGRNAGKARRLLAALEETHGRHVGYRDRLEDEVARLPDQAGKDRGGSSN